MARTLVLGRKWIKEEDFQGSVKMQRVEAMQEEQAKRRKHLPNMIDDTMDEIEHDIDLIEPLLLRTNFKRCP